MLLELFIRGVGGETVHRLTDSREIPKIFALDLERDGTITPFAGPVFNVHVIVRS